MARSTQLLLAAVTLALVLAGLSAADAHGLRRQHKLEAEIRQRDEKNCSLTEENVRLRREIRALHGDPAAVERAAREELGLVKSGEVVFTF
jgi:cell division protein FtsB